MVVNVMKFEREIAGFYNETKSFALLSSKCPLEEQFTGVPLQRLESPLFKPAFAS
jgi:hypothetical protein